MSSECNVSDVVGSVERFYIERIEEIQKISQQNNVGGQIRAASGRLVEDLIKETFDQVGSYYPARRVEIKKGETDRITCTNAKGNSIGMQVDKHCYIDGKLKAIMEAKSYLDRCYMIRASDDFKKIKEHVSSPPRALIVAIENSVAEESYNFIMDEGHCNEVFFLADGKRSSTKPIWKKEYYKPLNPEKLRAFVEVVDNLFAEGTH